MKELKQLISGFLIVLISIAAVPVFGEGASDISSYFELEFVDAKRYGLFDADWSNNLRSSASKEDIDIILRKVEDKLIPVDKYINTKFKAIKVLDKTNREGFLKSLYNLEGIYETDLALEKEAIQHLKDIGVLRGNGKEFYLDRKITYEEAIIFSKRMVDHVYNKKSACSKGILWKMEKNNTKIYMMASLDLGENFIYPLSKDILDKFNEADEIMLNVNMLDEKNNDREDIYYSDGSTLESKVGKELYKRIRTTMEAYGIEEDYYKNMKPWASLLVLTNLSLTGEEGEYSQELGVTRYLTEKAIKENKKIVELEGLDFQYDLLDSLTMDQQKYLIDNTINNIFHDDIESIDIKDFEEQIIEAWRLGDKKELKKLYLNRDKMEEINNILLVKRDKNMTAKIADLLERGEDKTYFIVLNAVHYLFEDTIIDELRAQGYEVEYLK